MTPYADRAVYCKGLRKSYGSTVALDGLDLEIPSGELFGLVWLKGLTTLVCLAAPVGLGARPGLKLPMEGKFSTDGNS